MIEWPLCERHNELLIKIVTAGLVDTVVARRAQGSTKHYSDVTFCKLAKKLEAMNVIKG